MAIHYYLTLFPMEALIASGHEPEKFATYMSIGGKKGSAEAIMFIELTGEFKSTLDWEYARKKCVPHADGRVKNSVYLSIYRTLEQVPLENMGDLYLSTKDGRSLRLLKSDYISPKDWKGYALYKELCPVNPLVVSKKTPDDFGRYMTDLSNNKVSVPTIVFADLKVIDPEKQSELGHVGSVYDRHPDHLKDCIDAINSSESKVTKTVDRTYMSRFAYSLINTGIYVSNGKQTVIYKMPNVEEIKSIDYDWGRSAMFY